MKKLIILSGLSGSGKTTALGALEDSGFFCVDNVPPSLVGQFAQLLLNSNLEKMALVVDVRSLRYESNTADFLKNIPEGLEKLVIFLDSGDEVIHKRYQYTRRKHPLGITDTREAAKEERKMLAPIREVADVVIDTSNMDGHTLRGRIVEAVSTLEAVSITVYIRSFGYRFGIPADSEFVFDVRFLPNPYYVEELRGLPGTDPKVQQYLEQYPDVKKCVELITSLILIAVERYKEQAKPELVVSIGCTGGYHRSVYVAEMVGKKLKQNNLKVLVEHRDMGV
ncbi:MAG: RNase adapter protein RapZ [Thermotogota bacterium]|nr:RNase adapter protein RapZ [Thermotogota bacterium]MDK2864994.1 RNase adapter protein RapZ [Thermotogota bacterium]HCZ06027.1 RNase adapter RapZ [Thermotogota bacterium]